MKIQIDEVEGEKDKNIAIRLSGGDIKFLASEYSCSIYIDEDIADSLVFHLGTILQDRERRKDLTNK